MTDRATISERYITAGNSSNLRVNPEKTTDADILIAAGLTPGIFGHALLRLHGEWDAFSRTRKIDQTEAILALNQLKSLRACLSALTAWATSKGMEDVEHMGIAVLGYWLDSVCRPCHGRGFETIRNTPALGKMCKHCEGSGRAKIPHGGNGRAALVFMEDCANIARESMKKRLSPKIPLQGGLIPKNSATGGSDPQKFRYRGV